MYPIGKLLLLLPVALTFFICLYLDQIGFQALSIFAVITTLFAIVMAPLHLSLFLVITFIWFQGFFKIISNFHPLVHVGADLVIIALLFKIVFFGLGDHKKAPPFTWIFAFHFCWVAITYFNPYSLGLVSNIAGSKVYISMFLLYFLGYYLIRELRDVKRLFGLFIALAIIQTGFAIYQGFLGPTSVTSLHPGYAVQLEKFQNYAFRPFGLTSLPGGPSVYIYMTLPFICYFIYESRSAIRKIFYSSLLPAIGLALVFCQIRSAIAKAVLSIVFFVLALNTSRVPIATSRKLYFAFGSVILALLTVVSLNYLTAFSINSYEDNSRALERSLSTFDMTAMAQARTGAIDKFLIYSKEVPFGAGFSRVGASAGAFENENKMDPFFPRYHFFSDNLFIHLLIELGFPGLLAISVLIFCILKTGYKIWRDETIPQLISIQIAILSPIVAIASGSYGAEGIIYNPESCFFWLFAGVMMSINESSFKVEA